MRRAAVKSTGTSLRSTPAVVIPRNVDNVRLAFGDRTVQLTNLRKPFWREPLITKGDLLQYYADVARVAAAAPARPRHGDEALPARRRRRLLLHEARARRRGRRWIETLPDRARVGQRHRLPDDPGPARAALGGEPRLHRSQPVVRARATTSIGPTTCTSISIPSRGAELRRRCARPRSSCATRWPRWRCRATRRRPGRRGIHVYVPIVRGPTQKQVWTFAKALAHEPRGAVPAAHHRRCTGSPSARAGRVLVDYNQNAWGRTLASIYSVRPRPRAPVSTPVTWDEIAAASRSRTSASTTCAAGRQARRPVGAAGAAAGAVRSGSVGCWSLVVGRRSCLSS